VRTLRALQTSTRSLQDQSWSSHYAVLSVTLTLLASCHSVQKTLNLSSRLNVGHPYKMAAQLYNCRRQRGRICALSYNLIDDYIYGTPCRYRAGSHSPGASSASVVTVTQVTVASAWCSNYWGVLIGLTDPLNRAVNMNYIQRPSPYRAVNTLRLGYTNHSVNAV